MGVEPQLLVGLTCLWTCPLWSAFSSLSQLPCLYCPFPAPPEVFAPEFLVSNSPSGGTQTKITLHCCGTVIIYFGMLGLHYFISSPQPHYKPYEYIAVPSWHLDSRVFGIQGHCEGDWAAQATDPCWSLQRQGWAPDANSLWASMVTHIPLTHSAPSHFILRCLISLHFSMVTIENDDCLESSTLISSFPWCWELPRNFP